MVWSEVALGMEVLVVGCHQGPGLTDLVDSLEEVETVASVKGRKVMLRHAKLARVYKGA